MSRVNKLRTDFTNLFLMLFTLTTVPLDFCHAADKPQRSQVVVNTIKPLPAMPELASYDTLIALPAEDREHYLHQLQLLLIDMAAVSRLSDNDSIAASSPVPASLHQILDWFFPQASAGAISCMNPVTDHLGAIHCENGYVTTDGTFVPDNGPQTKDAYDRVAHPEQYKNAQAQVPSYADPSTRDQCYVPPSKDGQYDDYSKENDFCKNQKKNKGGRKGSCIYAGNVSSYDAKGRCIPPKGVCKDGTVLPSGSGKCSDGASPFKCGANEVVCNPIAFGAKSSTKPFCVEIGGGLALTATRNCETASRKQKGSSDHSLSPEAFLASGDSAANEKAWNNLKKGFSKLCGKDGTQELARNCDACLVMRRRLLAMNARIKEARRKAAKQGSPHWNTCQWSADEDRSINDLKTKDIQDASPAKSAQ